MLGGLSDRREEEIAEEELTAEAGWIARTLDEPSLDAAAVERVLRAHRRYLGFPPPDMLVDPGELTKLEDRHGASGDPDQVAPGLTPARQVATG